MFSSAPATRRIAFEMFSIVKSGLSGITAKNVADGNEYFALCEGHKENLFLEQTKVVLPALLAASCDYCLKNEKIENIQQLSNILQRIILAREENSGRDNFPSSNEFKNFWEK